MSGALSTASLLERFAGTREQQIAQASTSDEVTAALAPLSKPALTPQQEYASRILSRRRLLPFVQRTNDRYDAGWVHADICMRLEKFSDDVAKGLSPRLMLLLPPRHGKACAVGTLVPTPSGFRAIETLRTGDYVFGRDGRPTRVVAVSETWRDRELFEVTSDDGASVIVDGEHEWTVRLCRKRSVHKTKTTRQLFERASVRAPALMTYAAVEYPEATLPVPPYALGVWLGDGSRHATITQGDQDYALIRAAIETEGVETTDRATAGTFGMLGVQTALKQLGVIPEKHIPEIYRTASVSQRRALLQGLIDTDGHVAPDGQIEFCSTSEVLAYNTLMLVRSLGVKASMILGDATLNGEFVSAKYRVMFYMAGAARLPRKAARCRDGVRSPHRFITVKPAGRGDTVCIQVEAADHQYLVGNGYLLTHNSELASKNFPAWHLGRHPDHEFIACSYNLSLAMGFSRKVKQIVEDSSYAGVFPSTKLDPNNQSTEEWGIANARGGYVAAGIGGPITGKGATCLVIDDPVKNAEEADSGDAREKIWEWYLSTAYSRLAPGGGVLLIQTWWHDDDLAGRIQQMMAKNPDDEDIDQFDVVKYPAIATTDEYLDPATFEIVYEPVEGANLLRSKGDALHPARYDLKKLNKIRALNRKDDGSDGRWWSALYQQNPVPDDGSYFTKDQFKRVALPPLTKCNVIIAWDFAISEKKQNDYTVGSVLLQDDDDVLHVAEVLRFKSGDVFFIVESILDLTARWMSRGLVLGFEDGQIYRAIAALLQKRMRERKMYPATEVLKPLTDKMVRARALQGRMQQGKVSFNAAAEWYDTVRSEMLRFPAGVHDDCVDSLAWAAQLAIGKEPPRKNEPRKEKSWRDRIASPASGGTHMAA